MQFGQQRYEPSYRLDSKNPYKREVCQTIIKQLIDKEMKHYEYDPEHADELCRKLSETIKASVKSSRYDRYKLIVVVTIGEKYLQDVSHSVSFLWDADRDGYSSYVYERPDLFVIATLYAVYYE